MSTGFFRVSLAGSLPGGEVWSVNPVFGVTAGSMATPDFATLNTLAEDIGESTIPVGVTAQMSTAVTMNRVRVEARSLANVLEAVGEAAVSPVQSGVGTANKPYQTTLCATILTARPGASGKGRLYIPTLAVPIDATLRVPDANCQAYVQGVHQWLQNIGGVFNAEFGAGTVAGAVYSPKLQLVSFSTRVSVGNVLDVQRRRRDKAVESRFQFPA